MFIDKYGPLARNINVSSLLRLNMEWRITLIISLTVFFCGGVNIYHSICDKHGPLGINCWSEEDFTGRCYWEGILLTRERSVLCVCVCAKFWISLTHQNDVWKWSYLWWLLYMILKFFFSFCAWCCMQEFIPADWWCHGIICTFPQGQWLHYKNNPLTIISLTISFLFFSLLLIYYLC